MTLLSIYRLLGEIPELNVDKYKIILKNAKK
jgi:hypothetical protein